MLDIALKYQYQTHETFTRAFKKEYGMAPYKFRKTKREHVLFEKIDIYNPRYKNLYSKDPVHIRFVTCNEFVVTGFSINTGLEDDQAAEDIPGFMNHFFSNQLFQHIPGIIHPEKFYGIYSNLDVHNNFKFTIAYETDQPKNVPGTLDMHVIPPRNYAVFEARGPLPEKVVSTWHYIYGNWLPNSEYQRESGIDFEIYDQRTLEGKDAAVDIYIPLKIVT